MTTETTSANDAQAPAVCCTPLGAPSLSDAEAEATARVFKALADPPPGQDHQPAGHQPRPGLGVRVHRTPRLNQPTVSHHLKKLVQAGLLTREQRGTWAYYSLNHDALGRLATITDLQGASR